jgi:hypothetical protein
MRKGNSQNRLHRGLFMLLSLWLPVATVRAQWTAQDSLRLQEFLRGDQDILINQDAVKSIQLDIHPLPSIKEQGMMSASKPWMQFVEDLPILYDDTVSNRRPQHIPLLPFSCFTRWNENPFALQEKLDKEKKRKMHWQIDKRHVTTGTGTLLRFSADDMLYETLTKRGRAIRRNRKHANAWKTYQDYVPTLQDSLLYYKRLRKEE